MLVHFLLLRRCGWGRVCEFGSLVEPRSKHDNSSGVAHIWPRAVVNGKTIGAPPNESGAKKCRHKCGSSSNASFAASAIRPTSRRGRPSLSWSTQKFSVRGGRGQPGDLALLVLNGLSWNINNPVILRV